MPGLARRKGEGRARRGWRRWVGGLLLLLGALASGCSNAPRNAAGEDTSQGSMRAGEFLQTDADRMATLAMRDNLQSLYQLLWKLYKRNPAEWKKTGLPSQADAELAIRRAIEQNRELSDLAAAATSPRCPTPSIRRSRATASVPSSTPWPAC